MGHASVYARGNFFVDFCFSFLKLESFVPVRGGRPYRRAKKEKKQDQTKKMFLYSVFISAGVINFTALIPVYIRAGGILLCVCVCVSYCVVVVVDGDSHIMLRVTKIGLWSQTKARQNVELGRTKKNDALTNAN